LPKTTESLNSKLFSSEINKSQGGAPSLVSTMYSLDAAHRAVFNYFACRRRHISEFHTVCCVGCQENIRCVYPANPVGSKLVSLGLDPAIHSEPAFNIIENVLPCVKFDVQQSFN
jgi:hypothetical protein